MKPHNSGADSSDALTARVVDLRHANAGGIRLVAGRRERKREPIAQRLRQHFTKKG